MYTLARDLNDCRILFKLIKLNGKGTLQRKVLFFHNGIFLWGRWKPSIKTKMVLFFNKSIFFFTNSLNVGISFQKNEIIQYYQTFFLPLNLLPLRYIICWFYIFIFFREVLKFWMHHCYRNFVLQYVPLLGNFFYILLVV